MGIRRGDGTVRRVQRRHPHARGEAQPLGQRRHGDQPGDPGRSDRRPAADGRCGASPHRRLLAPQDRLPGRHRHRLPAGRLPRRGDPRGRGRARRRRGVPPDRDRPQDRPRAPPRGRRRHRPRLRGARRGGVPRRARPVHHRQRPGVAARHRAAARPAHLHQRRQGLPQPLRVHDRQRRRVRGGVDHGRLAPGGRPHASGHGHRDLPGRAGVLARIPRRGQAQPARDRRRGVHRGERRTARGGPLAAARHGQAGRHRLLRLRLPDGDVQPGAAVPGLGPAPDHEHRVHVVHQRTPDARGPRGVVRRRPGRARGRFRRRAEPELPRPARSVRAPIRAPHPARHDPGHLRRRRASPSPGSPTLRSSPPTAWWPGWSA